MANSIRLKEIAHARSGDKGSDANVGVIAYGPTCFQLLRDRLTSEVVQSHFESSGVRTVERFELPNLQALNFILRGALGEGGSRSLRIDAQGKAFGVALLELQLEIDDELRGQCEEEKRIGSEEDA